jgi:hypothetical protein
MDCVDREASPEDDDGDSDGGVARDGEFVGLLSIITGLILVLFQSILLVGLCRTDLEYAYLTLFSLSMILKGEWRESGGLVRRRC